LPHFFGGAKKRVGRRDEHPATLHGSERCNASPAQHQQQWRLALCNRNRNRNRNRKGRYAERQGQRPATSTGDPSIRLLRNLLRAIGGGMA
jgi:hypothetical protein